MSFWFYSQWNMLKKSFTNLKICVENSYRILYLSKRKLFLWVNLQLLVKPEGIGYPPPHNPKVSWVPGLLCGCCFPMWICPCHFLRWSSIVHPSWECLVYLCQPLEYLWISSNLQKDLFLINPGCVQRAHDIQIRAL